MVIDLFTNERFSGLNILAQRGHENSGGGMACLMNVYKAYLSDTYKVRVCHEVEDLRSDLCVVDVCSIPFSTKSRGYRETTERRADEFLSHRENNPNSTKILMCAEKTLLRLLPETRKKLLQSADAIVVTCPYLWDLFKTIGIVPTSFLCDGIDDDIFRPAPKEMSVVGVGGLKYIKNIDFIHKAFMMLKGKIKRIYMGSAELWGDDGRKEDRDLLPKIQACTDAYYPNASPVQVAYIVNHAAFAINDTWHDCSSRANEEQLLAGVISIHGNHPLFNGRPGFHVDTPEEAVAKIAELTSDFTQMPDPKLHEDARQWALKNVSKDVFKQQFEEVMRYFL